MSADSAKTLRDARRKRGLTQDQVAEQMFVSRQTVSNWETGRTEPDYEAMKRLSALLGDGESPQSHRAASEDGAVESPRPVAGDGIKRKRLAVLALAAIVLLTVAVVLAMQPRRVSDLTPAWFMSPQEVLPDHAFVELSTKYNPLACPEAEPGVERYWDLRLIMREINGHAFYADKLRLVLYEKNGGNRVMDCPSNLLSTVDGPLCIYQNSAVVRYAQIPYDAQLCGVGALITGSDENGNDGTFRCYVELC